ncbi:MAG: hypothetical protein JWR55_842 [Aeromicrobium sp.]|nr:hypothetical protein [Aeromicrobium sp.]
MDRSALLVSLVLAALAAGCSSSRDAAVEEVTTDFRSAVSSEDAEAACRLLAEPVRYELELSSGSTCEVELLDVRLPAAGDIQEVAVSGTAAQVRYQDDVIFLGEFGDGWRVTAAGCLSRADGPYDCQVGG